MVHNSTLKHIERIASREWTNTRWLDYAIMRSQEVKGTIARLRRFANHDPNSKPGIYCLNAADELDTRLGVSLSTIVSKIKG